MSYFVTEIYPKVENLAARKRPGHGGCDAECIRNGHRYNHEFSSPARLLGLPDGTVIVLPDGQAFRLSNGSMLITDYD